GEDIRREAEIVMTETGSSLRSGRRPSPFAFDQHPATIDDTAVLRRMVVDEGKGKRSSSSSRRGAHARESSGEGRGTTTPTRSSVVVRPDDVTPKTARVDPDPRWNGSQLIAGGATRQAARGITSSSAQKEFGARQQHQQQRQHQQHRRPAALRGHADPTTFTSSPIQIEPRRKKTAAMTMMINRRDSNISRGNGRGT
ncbi:unnamed protein product, partial [Laminaria digitata]